MGPRKFEKTPFEHRTADETVSTERSARICAAPRTARLVLVHPRGLGEPQALAEAPVVLGRQRDADSRQTDDAIDVGRSEPADHAPADLSLQEPSRPMSRTP